jgi:hypothetical protein
LIPYSSAQNTPKPEYKNVETAKAAAAARLILLGNAAKATVKPNENGYTKASANVWEMISVQASEQTFVRFV